MRRISESGMFADPGYPGISLIGSIPHQATFGIHILVSVLNSAQDA